MKSRTWVFHTRYVKEETKLNLISFTIRATLLEELCTQSSPKCGTQNTTLSKASLAIKS